MINRSGRNFDARINSVSHVSPGRTERGPAAGADLPDPSVDAIAALIKLIELARRPLEGDDARSLNIASRCISELADELFTTVSKSAANVNTSLVLQSGRSNCKPSTPAPPTIPCRTEVPDPCVNLIPTEPDVVYKPKEKRVLVAEDDAVNQKVALWQLREMGFAVDIAVNGNEAVRASFESEYAIIFMDCEMPVQNGFEATKAIREREKGGESRVPIIAMTAHATEADRARCLAAGMDDYLSKPVRADDLKRVLRSKLADFAHRGGEPLAFEMLEQNLGSEASLEILDVYVRSAAELVIEIQEGIRKQSHSTVSTALNELNSSCTVVGASGIVQQCNIMLKYLQKADWARMEGCMAELVRETRTVGQYVSELLSKPVDRHI